MPTSPVTMLDEDGYDLAANGLAYLTTRSCVKCDDDEPLVEYVRLAGSECSQKQIGCPPEVAEHLHRRCRSCGFEWPEACLDTPPKLLES